MYGTVARMRVKAGSLDSLKQMAESEDMSRSGGFLGVTIYQMDADPNELMMSVVFESKDAYVKNAESPEQNEMYEKMVSMLEGPPEWHDGEILFHV